MKSSFLLLIILSFFNLSHARDLYTQSIYNDFAKLKLPNTPFINGRVAQFNLLDGTIESSSTSITQLSYLDGLTGNIQDQIDGIISGGGFEPTITPGTLSQYWRGDKTFQTLDTNAVTDALNKRYVTDAEKTKLANLSGVNTGDQDLSSYATQASVNSVSNALTLKSPIDPIAGIFYVRSDYSGVETGTRAQPYNTFAEAQAAAFSAGANSVIMLLDKGMTDNWVINNYNANLLVMADGMLDSNAFKLTGSITVSGTSTRIRFLNIQVQAPSGPDIIYDGCDGRMYLYNVQAMGGGIELRNSWKRWYEFTDSSATAINIIGTPSNSPLVSTFRMRGAPAITLNAGSSASLQLFDSASIGAITHTNGNLIIDGGRGITGAITSTANSPALFRIYNFSMLNPATQTFMQINKTGTAPYILSGVLRDEAIDVLTGTRTYQGLTSIDSRYVPGASGDWVTQPDSVKLGLDYLAAKTKGLFNLVTTSSYTIAGQYRYINVNYAGTSTITLPSAIGFSAEDEIVIKNLSANNVDVATVLSQTIDGLASPGTLTGINNSITLKSNGANWFIN